MSENLTSHEMHDGFQMQGKQHTANLRFNNRRGGGGSRSDRGYVSKIFNSSSRRGVSAYGKKYNQGNPGSRRDSQNDDQRRHNNSSSENPNRGKERGNGGNRNINTNVTPCWHDGMTIQTADNAAETAKNAPLNPSATEFKPVGSVSCVMDMSQEAMLETAKSGQYSSIEECTTDISFCEADTSCSTTDVNSQNCLQGDETDEVVENVADAMNRTTLSSSSVLDSVDSDNAVFKGIVSNTSGKIQDSKFKPSRNIANMSQADYNRNDNFSPKQTPYDLFFKKYKSKGITDYTIVSEKEADLFTMDETYALGNCVAADFNMGSGIAVGFRQRFKNVNELLAQRQSTGGLAVLKHIDGRYVYYLVTKQESNKKPTNWTLFSSLEKLKNHMVENNVKKLAIPRLGCGLDRLDWNMVKPMIEYIFTGTDVEIIVCNFQKATESMSENKEKLLSRKCKVSHLRDSIANVDEYSMIIYLGYVDGFIDETILNLNRNFNIMAEYKSNARKLGEIVITNNRGYKFYLLGCIVKKGKGDKVDLSKFGECVKDINKMNNKFRKSQEHYSQVAIQTYHDPTDEILMSKIENLLRNSLFDFTVTVYDK